MRKVSKSRTEDDVVSSTNGSINHEPVDTREVETEQVVENADGNDSQEGKAENGDDDGVSEDSSKEKSKKKAGKTRGRKKKTTKSKDMKADEEYEVEKVINSKKIKGKLHYLIRWKGYSPSSDTWEPANTLSCPELINKFNTENEGNAKKESKEKQKANKRKSDKTESKSPAKKAKTSWDSENADENEEYEVERIMEVHHKKNGDREFLIHWKGWSSKFDSWEPEEHLNCSDLIKKFMSKVNSARTIDTKNLRVAPGTTNRFTLQDPTHGRRLSKRRGQKQRVRYDDAE